MYQALCGLMSAVLKCWIAQKNVYTHFVLNMILNTCVLLPPLFLQYSTYCLNSTLLLLLLLFVLNV
jgi:hypothetical protein